MKKILCRILGHDPMSFTETEYCKCSPNCVGQRQVYKDTKCIRCWADYNPWTGNWADE